MNSSKKSLIEKDILEILEEEVDALKSSNFHLLEKIRKQKEFILNKIAKENASYEPKKNSEILNNSARNARFFEAALDGIKASQEKIIQIRSAYNRLTIYHIDGSKQEKDLSAPTMSKKA